MKILAQNNQPTSGNIISSDNIGYLIEEPKLFLSKTGLENLKYLSNLYGVDYNQERFRSLIQELDLTQSIKLILKKFLFSLCYLILFICSLGSCFMK